MSMLIITMLVVAFSLPAAAGPFSDIPADHWAYEAVTRLVASGIIEGYPDGTYRGEERISRYEAAVIVAGVMENLELTVEELQADVKKLGLSAEEAVQRAVEAAAASEEALRAAEEAAKAEPGVEVPEGISEDQAQNIREIITALTFELEDELATLEELRRAFRALQSRFNLAVDEIVKVPVLEYELGTLEEELATLKEDMALLREVNPVVFSGDYKIEISDLQIKNDGVEASLLEDPFDSGSDEIEPGTTFEQKLGVDLDISVAENIALHLGLSGIKHDFGYARSADLALDAFDLKLDTPEIRLDAGRRIRAAYAPYALHNYRIDGVQVGFKNTALDLLLGRRDASGVDTLYFAGKTGTSYSGIDLGAVFAGTAVEDGLERKIDRKILGFDAAAEYAGIDFEMDFATALDVAEESNLVRLMAATGVGPAEVAFTYRNIHPGFSPLHEDGNFFKGGDLYTSSLNPGIRGVTFEAEGDLYGVATGLLVASVNPEQNVDRADARLVRITGSQDNIYLDGLKVDGFYEYEYNTDNDADLVTTRGFDVDYTGIDNTLVSLGYRLRNPIEDASFVPERTLELGVGYSLAEYFEINYDFENINSTGMYEAAEKRANTIAVNMVDYPVMNAMVLSAGYEMETVDGTDKDAESIEERTNTLSVGAVYDLNPLLVSAGFTRRTKDGAAVSPELRRAAFSETDLGVKYNVAENTAISVGYHLGIFNAEDTDYSYNVQEATAGLSLEF